MKQQNRGVGSPRNYPVKGIQRFTYIMVEFGVDLQAERGRFDVMGSCK